MLFSDRISLPYLVIIQDTMLYVGKWVATTRFPNVAHALFQMIDCRTHPFSPIYFVMIIVVPALLEMIYPQFQCIGSKMPSKEFHTETVTTVCADCVMAKQFTSFREASKTVYWKDFKKPHWLQLRSQNGNQTSSTTNANHGTSLLQREFGSNIRM